MKSYIIISGGRVDLYSLQGIMDRHLESSRVIAVDKGIETCNKIGIVPDVIVGDFDSASKVTVGVFIYLGMFRQIALNALSSANPDIGCLSRQA